MASARGRRRASATSKKDATTALNLPADLRIAACPAVRDALLALHERDDLALDAGVVTRVDATGLQLLVAACRDRRTRGGRVSWLAVSEPLRAAAELCGLAETLCLENEKAPGP
jgi:anti-anti-sigma factor